MCICIFINTYVDMYTNTHTRICIHILCSTSTLALAVLITTTMCHFANMLIFAQHPLVVKMVFRCALMYAVLHCTPCVTPCVCMYLSMCVCVYVCTCVCVCICVCVYVCMCECVYVCMCVCVYVCMCVCV